MFTIKFDNRHNLLMLEFRSNFNEQQGELLCKKMEKELSKAKKGFVALTDLSRVNNFDDLSIKYIKKTMTIVNAHGVSKIFRIIPDNTKDCGFNVLSIFHYTNNVKTYTYKSKVEAQYHLKLNSNIIFTDKIITILRILRIKASNMTESIYFRYFVIIFGFALSIVLRQVFKAFGISLGYLYILMISLAGFWFEVKGGIIAAIIATLIFTAEVNFFDSWIARDLVLKSMAIRFAIYFLSGIVIGSLSRVERNLRKRMEFLAVNDELTGLLNYRFSLEFLKKESERSKRFNKKLSIAILDIDHFKTINDTYGHLVGNDCLKKFSKIIKNDLRETDIACRYGGDEFFLIFPESSCEQGVKILERIKYSVAATKITSSFLINENSVTLTFSAGIVSFTDYSKTVDELIGEADKALYRAKETGRNRIIKDSVESININVDDGKNTNEISCSIKKGEKWQ